MVHTSSELYVQGPEGLAKAPHFQKLYISAPEIDDVRLHLQAAVEGIPVPQHYPLVWITRQEGSRPKVEPIDFQI